MGKKDGGSLMERYDYQQQQEEQERREKEDLGDWKERTEYLAECKRLAKWRKAWADWADEKEHVWP
jgi:hypothetical protein